MSLRRRCGINGEFVPTFLRKPDAKRISDPRIDSRSRGPPTRRLRKDTDAPARSTQRPTPAPEVAMRRLDGASIKYLSLTFTSGKTLKIPVETILHNDWKVAVDVDDVENTDRRTSERMIVNSDEVVVDLALPLDDVEEKTRKTMMEPTGLAVCLQGVLWRESALGEMPDEVMKQFIGHYARLGATQIHLYTRNGEYVEKVGCC